MSSFEDKYHLTSEQSIFLAKKKWDENVYCGMKIENRNGRHIWYRLCTTYSRKRNCYKGIRSYLI